MFIQSSTTQKAVQNETSDTLSTSSNSPIHLPVTSQSLIEILTTTEITNDDDIPTTISSSTDEISTSTSITTTHQSTSALQQVAPSQATSSIELCTIANIGSDLNGLNFISIPGDFTITFYTSSTTNILELLITRINNLKLVGLNTTIGLRGFQVTNFEEIVEFLVEEMQFQKKCVVDSLGIFVTREIWNAVRDVAANYNFDVWILEDKGELLFPQIAHMLYELPWRERDVTIEVKAPSTNLLIEFENAVKGGDLCFGNVSNSDGDKIVIVINDEIFKVHQPIGDNEKIFSIPIGIHPEVLECKNMFIRI